MTAPNLILLYGNDEYAIHRRLAEFEATFGNPTSASMNLARLEGSAIGDDALNNAVNAMPFLAEQRVVLLVRPSLRYTTPEQRDKFCEFLEKAPPSTRLVLAELVELKWRKTREEQDKEDDKTWPVKWFRKRKLGLERFALPALRDMPRWIQEQAQQLGGKLEGDAAARLADMVGTNTRQASQEITKLLTYVNWQRPVNLLDVQAVSIVTAEADIFGMVDALAQGQGRQAQLLMHRLLADQEAFGVWAMIIRQFRLLIQAREVMDAGGGLPEVWKQLGGPEFVAKKVHGQARRLSMPVLERVYHRLLEIDVAAKTGGTPLDVSMEMLVTELTG